MQTCFTASGGEKIKKVMQISIHAVTLSTDLKLQSRYTHLTFFGFVFGAAFFTVASITKNTFISSLNSFWAFNFFIDHTDPASI